MGKWSLLITLIAFVSINTLQGHNAGEDLKREFGMKKARFIAITQLDSITGYQKTLTLPDEDLNTLEAEKLDSMVNTWYIQNAYADADFDVNNIPAELKKSLPDSVYIQRLQNIDTEVDLSFNNTVKNFIALYTIKRREQVSIMLGLANYYFPILEEILDKYNLPLELKYMAVIESALNPKAYSRAGACGLWQFMYGTGKMYGLEINTFVDERRDPIKATDAAARFLSDMYKVYGDWHLVIAAYNCGPGNVNKAIRRSGGARNYWEIYYRLPRETRGYVPAFIAATYAMTYAAEHQLAAKEPDFHIATDTLHVRNYLHYDQLVNMLNLDKNEISYLNPQYRRNVIPAKASKPYPLKLPVDAIGKFIDSEKEIYAYNREKYFPNNEIVTPKSRSAGYYTPVDVDGKDKVYYTVKPGDNVGFIATWFHVRASDLRYWNNIRRNLIKVGQKLVIYVPKGKGSYYKRFNKMSFAQKKAAASGKAVANTASSASTEKTTFDKNKFTYYTVRKGDNFWTIARRYPGISNNDIMRFNNIKDAKSLHPGQKLKIPLIG